MFIKDMTRNGMVCTPNQSEAESNWTISQENPLLLNEMPSMQQTYSRKETRQEDISIYAECKKIKVVHRLLKNILKMQGQSCADFLVLFWMNLG
jgi:hypothetical protein